jgi:hypothetical protein
VQEDGKLSRRKSVANIPITETPEDLKLLERDAEEFSYFDLQKQIGDMKTKGIDTTAPEVDLQIKLAIPLVSFLMVLCDSVCDQATDKQQHIAQLRHDDGDRLRVLGAGPLHFLRSRSCAPGASPAWILISFFNVGLYFFI